mmetsp:Transcript_4703/g.6992  ORF Transcript_4703/g.6992 Transcript_4703/m.6992 type:complete len:118 (-) Transcript_4703:256-609(-)
MSEKNEGSSMLWQGSGDGSKGDSLLQIVDCFLFYFLLVSGLQLLYFALGGAFPFASFLAGLLSSVGMFVLTVGLRIHLSSSSSTPAPGPKLISKERAVLEWLACTSCLLLVAFALLA